MGKEEGNMRQDDLAKQKNEKKKKKALERAVLESMCKARRRETQGRSLCHITWRLPHGHHHPRQVFPSAP